MVGPHGAPDFFTDKDINTFFSTAWEVHYNSSRTGVRLIGPKPEWARRDGGEAGCARPAGAGAQGGQEGCQGREEEVDESPRGRLSLHPGQ